MREASILLDLCIALSSDGHYWFESAPPTFEVSSPMVIPSLGKTRGKVFAPKLHVTRSVVIESLETREAEGTVEVDRFQAILHLPIQGLEPGSNRRWSFPYQNGVLTIRILI